MRVIVYGGCGNLGKYCVQYFIKNSYWVLSIGHNKNAEASANIVIPQNLSWIEEENYVSIEADKLITSDKVDAIFCVAGGWAGGGIKSKNMIKNADLMWRQSVFSSSIAAKLAYRHLEDNGLVVLCASKACLEPTPFMLGYGMAKSAVLNLNKSLGSPKSNMPTGSTSLAILIFKMSLSEIKIT